ncbi:unnamed protein product [Colias eurytheme]|nr:unnamed protein product [Colias eurytheme]
MKTITINEPINLKVVSYELDFSTLFTPRERKQKKKDIKIPLIRLPKKHYKIPSPPVIKNKQQSKDVKSLVEELLDDIYADRRDWSHNSDVTYSHGSTTAPSFSSSQSNYGEQTDAIERSYLESLQINELHYQIQEWGNNLQSAGARLAKCLRTRDRLKRQQKKLCAAFTILLRHIIPSSVYPCIYCYSNIDLNKKPKRFSGTGCAAPPIHSASSPVNITSAG